MKITVRRKAGPQVTLQRRGTDQFAEGDLPNLHAETLAENLAELLPMFGLPPEVIEGILAGFDITLGLADTEPALTGTQAIRNLDELIKVITLGLALQGGNFGTALGQISASLDLSGYDLSAISPGGITNAAYETLILFGEEPGAATELSNQIGSFMSDLYNAAGGEPTDVARAIANLTAATLIALVNINSLTTSATAALEALGAQVATKADKSAVQAQNIPYDFYDALDGDGRAPVFSGADPQGEPNWVIGWYVRAPRDCAVDSLQFYLNSAGEDFIRFILFDCVDGVKVASEPVFLWEAGGTDLAAGWNTAEFEKVNLDGGKVYIATVQTSGTDVTWAPVDGAPNISIGSSQSNQHKSLGNNNFPWSGEINDMILTPVHRPRPYVLWRLVPRDPA